MKINGQSNWQNNNEKHNSDKSSNNCHAYSCSASAGSHRRSTNCEVQIPTAQLWRLVTLLACSLLIWDNCINYVLAAPQPYGDTLCDKNDASAKKKRESTDVNQLAQYEEYLLEHQVTQQEAALALQHVNFSFYEENRSSCKAVPCTKREKDYCMDRQFINDHCLCELGHNEEGLPFVPHNCYVRRNMQTKPSVGTCFFYEELKDCCCILPLAKYWRRIAAPTSSAPPNAALLWSIALPVASGVQRLIAKGYT